MIFDESKVYSLGFDIIEVSCIDELNLGVD